MDILTIIGIVVACIIIYKIMEHPSNKIPGTPIQHWVPIAQDISPFTLAEPTYVRYGAEGGWSPLRLFPAGTYSCNVKEFGGVDPNVGVHKHCEALKTLLV